MLNFSVGIDDSTKEKVAIKMMSKDQLDQEGGKFRRKLNTEVEIMKKLTHPNIVKLIGVQESSEHVCLILEYCSTGEFFDLISK